MEGFVSLIRCVILAVLIPLWVLVFGLAWKLFWPKVRLRRPLDVAVTSAWLFLLLVAFVVTWFTFPFLLDYPFSIFGD